MIIEAVRAFLDPHLLLPSLIASWIAALLCGGIGPLVVSRRLVFLAGAIAHIAVGGIGASLWLRYHMEWKWFDPVLGALSISLISAVLLSFVHHYARAHMDMLIGALWAVGMAIGIILAKLTPGYHGELMGYLFGSLAMTSWSEVLILIFVTICVLVIYMLYYKKFIAIALDSEQAQLQGINVFLGDMVFLIVIACTAVVLTRVVGLLLVIALLSLPSATAARLYQRLFQQILFTIGLCLFLVTVPRILVFGSRIAPEPAIILSAAGVYMLSLVVALRVQRS